ncbi:M48 family metallopeptidase [Sinomicrobium weinanense]|uniref:M48 family metallopeptidase n=1 Tax=Sinomicrobium weinanense TaxID=2842200 RepID=A0A926JR48_9FLAO|nr:M48 family metallopeptidase [Sinomicrobium weinanense]MBC9795962.1 M48 family metallopeptidase [Sinomicrobium weinanense]MBU3122081.1 M48 family metallopeptidase [Sinomicrobium weinanense]
MRKIWLSFLLLFFVLSCKTNPFTGKSTLNFHSNSSIFPMAFQQYDEFLKEHKVVKGTADAEKVRKVGQRIANAAEKWLNANGYEGYLKDYKWEYNLVQDDQVNAWCMPGGKIVVYTGLLPVSQTETGLAVVMGHEVAHALADHGAQRMSAGTLQQLGAVGVAVATSGKSAQAQQLWAQAYGVGSQVGAMLPFSRKHENEADAIGIQIMAIAGYDPSEAARLWQRMKAKGGQGPPEMLSTHPSSDTRIRNLTQLAPGARAEARKFGVTSFQ